MASVMVRVRRVRPSPVVEEAPAIRVRRVRGAAPKPVRSRYIIDWEKPWASLFQLYLITSYLYYDMNRSVITDHAYDRLCQVLLEGWKTGRHPHKHCVTEGDLHAGTGYAIKYPRIVAGAAMQMLKYHDEL